ncbi:MAG: twin-arginine translocation signal domain-containing protein [Halolamina sp.]
MSEAGDDGAGASDDGRAGGVGDLSRRQLLGLVAGAGVAGAVGSRTLSGGPEPAETETVTDEEARRLARRYAPRVYFGVRERWFPTDPRALLSAGESATPATAEATETATGTGEGSETLLSGFRALNEYVRLTRERGGPPSPTCFYHARSYPDSPLAVVQFWFYSAFDQFATNFHWHDWEVLHVFVDRSSGEASPTDGAAGTEARSDATATATTSDDGSEPILFVASAHARRVPNNEFLDPVTDRAAVISEVGSHSSALGVNDRPSSFQRFGDGGLSADITNSAVDVLSGQTGLPLAYGLPRDEGTELPYAVPELDGAPVYEHPRLPDVSRDDLVPSDVVVRSFEALSSPPSLPERETGTVFVPESVDGSAEAEPDAEADATVSYDLVPMSAVRVLDGLTGPQLSFEFTVPTFAEDVVAGHLTSAGVPWNQPRFTRPTADITDPAHRRALAARYDVVQPPETGATVVASLRQLVASEDAPDGNGVDATVPSAGGVARLESEATASATSTGGVVALRDVPPGDHRLTVNAPGLAPYAQGVSVAESAAAATDDTATETETATPTRTESGGVVALGADGVVAAPANEDAVKLRVETADASRVVVDDDFAGRVVDGRPLSTTGVGAYVHRGGAYTVETEAETADRGRGVARLNPDADDDAVAAAVNTGKDGFAEFLLRTLAETRLQVAALQEGTDPNDVPTGQGVDRDVLADVVETARGEAGESAGNGDRSGTDDGGETATDADGNAAEGDGENSTRGLLTALSAAVAAAAAADEAARGGDPEATDRRLRGLTTRLEAVADVLDRRDVDPELAALVERRVAVVADRAETATTEAL